METLLAIFEQLKINSSVFPQFAIIVVVYFISRFLFLNKLQNVLEQREEKTVKAETGAEDLFTKVEDITKKYKAQIEDAHKKSKSFLNEKKTNIMNEQDKRYKIFEAQVGSYLDANRKELKTEFESKKTAILADADNLSEVLLNKFAKK